MTATVTRQRPNRKTTQRSAPSTRRTQEPKRPALRVVDKHAIKRKAQRRALVRAAATVLVCGLFGVALAYAELAEGQQHLDEVRSEITETNADIARLERDIVEASSPHAVVARATELGMVRSQNPVYLTAAADPTTSEPDPGPTESSAAESAVGEALSVASTPSP